MKRIILLAILSMGLVTTLPAKDKYIGTINGIVFFEVNTPKGMFPKGSRTIIGYSKDKPNQAILINSATPVYVQDPFEQIKKEWAARIEQLRKNRPVASNSAGESRITK